MKGLARGGAVVSRPGTRVDGNSPPRARGLVLQVSKYGVAGNKGGLDRDLLCVNIVIYDL